MTKQITPEEAIEDADYHEENGELDVAIHVLRQAVNETPDHPKLHALLGRVMYLAGQQKAAITQFDIALAIKPDAPSTLYFRARAKCKSKLYDEALVDYEAVLRLQPSSSDALDQMSRILTLQGKHEASLSHLRRAQEIAGDNLEDVSERISILELKVQESPSFQGPE